MSDNTLIESGVKTLVFSSNTFELYSSKFIDLFLLLLLLFFSFANKRNVCDL